MQHLRVLGKIARAGLQRADDTPAGVLDFEARPDCIAVRARAAQCERYGVASFSPLILKRAHLRPQTVLQEQIETSIAIQIGNGKGPAVFRAVDAGNSGIIIKASGTPRVENVGLTPVPTVLSPDQMIEGVPSVFVGG